MRKVIDWLVVQMLKRNVRGGVRLRNLVCQNRRVEIETKHGIRIMTNPFEGIDLCVIRNGFYEEEVYIAVEGILKADDVFWDVGSNLGLHALSVKKTFPNVKVLAFEPNPAMANLLVSTAAKNELEIAIHSVALDRTDGEAEFFIRAGNSGRCGLRNTNSEPNLSSVLVETKRGDTLIANGLAEPPNVIKIDIEGHEVDALQGLCKTLESKTLRAIVFEDIGDEESPVKEMLVQNGFHIRRLIRLDDVQANLENFLATRPGPHHGEPRLDNSERMVAL